MTLQASDKMQLLPMCDKGKQQSGQMVKEALADHGYRSEENLRKAARTRIGLYVATYKQKHHQPPPTCSCRPIPDSATQVEKIKRRLMT